MKIPFCFIYLMYFSTFAAPNSADMAMINFVLEKYHVAPAVDIKIQKTVELGVLGDTQKSEGRLLISKGRLKLDIDKPEKSQIVMGKKFIWVVTPSPKELGGQTQVLKIEAKKLGKSAKAPLAFLLGQTSAWEQLEISSSQKEKDKILFKLVPKKNEGLDDITYIQIDINTKKNEISKIGYADEMDNVTQYIFTESNFKAKACDKDFNYVPSKNSQVTEYK